MTGQDEGRTDDDEATADPGASAGGAAVDPPRSRRPPPSPPLPWYRRGVVWFWFVVASVVGALVVAQVAEDRIYAYDVDPGSDEARAWCVALEPIDRGVGLWGGLNGDPQLHARRMETLRAGSSVAPAEIAGDLDEVIEAELERQERVTSLQERRSAGEIVSNDEVEDLEQEHHVAYDRVRGFHRQACPIG